MFSIWYEGRERPQLVGSATTLVGAKRAATKILRERGCGEVAINADVFDDGSNHSDIVARRQWILGARDAKRVEAARKAAFSGEVPHDFYLEHLRAPHADPLRLSKWGRK